MKWENRRFFGCVAASAYHIISHYIFRHNHNFRHTGIYEQPTLTKQWNYNIFVHILYSYLRYTDTLLVVFFLLLTEILLEFYEKKRRKDWVAEESTWTNWVRDIAFLAARLPSFYIVCRFFHLLRFYKGKKFCSRK